MANIIGTKKYMHVVAVNPNTGQMESRVVKPDSSSSKLTKKQYDYYEQSVRHSRRLDGK